jgi:hypothetical protein
MTFISEILSKCGDTPSVEEKDRASTEKKEIREGKLCSFFRTFTADALNGGINFREL